MFYAHKTRRKEVAYIWKKSIINIRDLFFRQGKSISEIAHILKYNWRTVRKYVDMEDFNLKNLCHKKKRTRISKLEPFKGKIDEWLFEDMKMPRKQRHTAKRIFCRLENEAGSFNASYRLVAGYVAARKKVLNLNKQPGSIPLRHFPG